MFVLSNAAAHPGGCLPQLGLYSPPAGQVLPPGRGWQILVPVTETQLCVQPELLGKWKWNDFDACFMLLGQVSNQTIRSSVPKAQQAAFKIQPACINYLLSRTSAFLETVRTKTWELEWMNLNLPFMSLGTVVWNSPRQTSPFPRMGWPEALALSLCASWKDASENLPSDTELRFMHSVCALVHVWGVYF